MTDDDDTGQNPLAAARSATKTPKPESAAAAEAAASGEKGSLDHALAVKMAAQHGQRMRWVQPWNRWMFYKQGNGVWQSENREGALIAARATCGPKKATKNLGPIVREAKTLMNALPDDFDGPALRTRVVVGNGVFDLEKGELGPHDPGLLATKRSPIAYDAAAECPTWERHLQIMVRVGIPVDSPTDEGLVEFMQLVCGMALLGYVPEHVFVLLLGEGGNGKGTFVRILEHVAGDYAETMPRSLLFAKDDAHPVALKTLKGLRLAFFEEVQSGKDLNTAVLKNISGGDTIKARSQHADFDPGFKPTHLPIGTSNSLPDLGGDTSEGLWRRLRPIQCGPKIPEEAEDPRWEERLEAEAPGILRWWVEGAMKYLELHRQGQKLPFTPSMRALLAEYRAEQDPFHEWADSRLVFAKGEEETSEKLYADYKYWHGQAGNPGNPESSNALGRWLAKRGCSKIQRGKERRKGWSGVVVVKSEDASRG